MWCNRCGCIHYLIRARLSHHVNWSGKSVEGCDGGPRGIPSLGVVVVATAMVAAGIGGLFGEGGECWEVAAP